MKLGTVLTWSFFTSLVISVVGAFMKILHLPGAEQLLIIAIAANAIFIIAALNEVWGSNKVNKIEKIMWTSAFISIGFLGVLAGIIYLSMGRKCLVK